MIAASPPRILLSALLSFAAGTVALVGAGFLVSTVPALATSDSALLLLPVAFLGAALGTATLVLDVGGWRDTSTNRSVLRAVLGDRYAPLAPGPPRAETTAPTPSADVAKPPPMFAETLQLVLTPKPARFGGAPVLVISAALFALTWFGGSFANFAVIVAVLLFHEAGHLLAMRLFGYSDLRIFFIPFFGAAASGRKDGAPGWQQAIVLLMGPAPGLLVGALVLLAAGTTAPPLILYGAKMFVWINALNLLPLEPFDGGRLLHVLLFSRHHVLELLFLVFTSVAVGLLGHALHSTAFVVLAVFGVLFAGGRARITKAGIGLRKQWGVMRLESAPDGYLRALFAEAEKVLQPRTPEKLAGYMRTLHERAAVDRMGVAPSLGLLALYGVALAIAGIGAILSVTHAGGWHHG